MTPENKIALKKQLEEDSKLTQFEISKRTNMSKQTINDIIWGRNHNKKLVTRVVNMIGFDFTKYHN